MRRDYLVIVIIISCSVLSILLFIRKENIRKAFLAVLVAQFFTWPIGLLFTLFGMIEYPVRLFPKAVNSSFLHGFILNPTVYAIYYIHYPKQAKLLWRGVYTLLFISIPVSIEIFESKYTNLLKYKSGRWYYTWILGLIIYFAVRKYLDWFFKNTSKQGVSRNEA